MRRALLAVLAGEVRQVFGIADGCTSIGVSKGASADGSTMTTHNADCIQCDSRVVYVPAKDWPEGSQRPVYGVKMDYPREVGTDRAWEYAALPGQNASIPIGFVPQVPHTYGYWEIVYAYMNEWGLTIGEATSAGKYAVTIEPLNATTRKTLMWIKPLTQIAMERCKNARCAIDVMGYHAETYGFFGEDPGQPGAGEQLTVGDGEELWVFEVTSEPNQKSAFWAARRVQDGHVVVLANNFMIRELDCDDRDNCRCSTDLPAKLKEAGAWDGTGKPDWLKAVGQDIRDFSYSPGLAPIPLYTTARLWRIYNLVAPSLALELHDNPYIFPFSVKAESPITHRRLMDFKRDHYEGTEIDMTVGPLAGPFGTPNRVEGGLGIRISGGQFPRAISIPRTSFGTLGQSYGSPDGTKALTKLWVAMDTPATSVYVPFYVNSTGFAEPYRIGHRGEYNDRSAWWVFDMVANYMDLNYHLMSVDVKAKITELQDMIDADIPALEVEAQKHLSTEDGRDTAFGMLSVFQERVQHHVVDTWGKLRDFLFMKYNDGYQHYPTVGTSVGYPAWWLETFCLDKDIRPKWAMPSSAPPKIYNLYGPGPFDIPKDINITALKPNANICQSMPWDKDYDNLAARTPAAKVAPQSGSIAAALMTVGPYMVVFLIGWVGGTARARNQVVPQDSFYVAAPSA